MKTRKRLNLVLLLVLFLSSHSSFSQLSLQWVRKLGGGFNINRPLGPGPDSDNCISRKAYSVATDPMNNIFVAGYYADSTDFGDGVWMIPPPATHKNVMFLAKYDSTGNFLFVKNFFGIGNGGATGHRFDNIFIRTDASGNVYMTAWLRGGATDLDPGSGVFTGQAGRYYLIKLTAGGNFVNAIQLPATADWSLAGVSDPSEMAKIYKIKAGHFYVKDRYKIYRYDLNLNLGLTIDVRSSSGLENNEFSSCFITSFDVDADGIIYCSLISSGAMGCFMDNSKPWLVKYAANGTRMWTKPFIKTDKIQLFNKRIRATGYLLNQLPVDADPGPDSFFVSASDEIGYFRADFDTSGGFLLARNGSRFTAGKNYARSRFGHAMRILGTPSISDMNTTNDSLRYHYEGESGPGTFLARGIQDFAVSISDDYDNLISLVPFGGIGDETVYDWTDDRSGNLILAGTFSDADDCDYDPGPATVKLSNVGMVPHPIFNNRVSTAIFLLKLKLNP